jgi:hypothetical protein
MLFGVGLLALVLVKRPRVGQIKDLGSDGPSVAPPMPQLLGMAPVALPGTFLPRTIRRARPIEHHGDAQFAHLLPKLRCSQCQSRPAPVHLCASPKRRGGNGGPSPDWAIELVPDGGLL